jgi:hypothetical protein
VPVHLVGAGSKNESFSSGLLAVIDDASTTQIDTPSWRRV